MLARAIVLRSSVALAMSMWSEEFTGQQRLFAVAKSGVNGGVAVDATALELSPLVLLGPSLPELLRPWLPLLVKMRPSK